MSEGSTFTENKEAVCGIHTLSWYKETPCFDHRQVERDNTKCRIGIQRQRKVLV